MSTIDVNASAVYFTPMDVNAHFASMATAIKDGVRGRAFSYEDVARASGLTSRGIRRIANRETSPHAETLTKLENGLKKMGVELATMIVKREPDEDANSHVPTLPPVAAKATATKGVSSVRLPRQTTGD